MNILEYQESRPNNPTTHSRSETRRWPNGSACGGLHVTGMGSILYFHIKYFWGIQFFCCFDFQNGGRNGKWAWGASRLISHWTEDPLAPRNEKWDLSNLPCMGIRDSGSPPESLPLKRHSRLRCVGDDVFGTCGDVAEWWGSRARSTCWARGEKVWLVCLSHACSWLFSAAYYEQWRRREGALMKLADKPNGHILIEFLARLIWLK